MVKNMSQCFTVQMLNVPRNRRDMMCQNQWFRVHKTRQGGQMLTVPRNRRDVMCQNQWFRIHKTRQGGGSSILVATHASEIQSTDNSVPTQLKTDFFRCCVHSLPC